MKLFPVPPCLPLLALLLAGCSAPVYPGAEWAETAPEKKGVDSEKLESAMAALGPDAGNIVVVRGGEMIFHQGDPALPMPLYSASKSITSLVFATLIQRGEATVTTEFADLDHPDRPAPTAGQLLSMTGNFGLEPFTPGTHYAYNNRGYQFLGASITDRWFRGEEPDAVLQGALLDRIGHQDPVAFTGQWGGWDGGFQLSARDLARLGLLVLRDGRWEDDPLLPAEFVAALFEPQIPADAVPSTSGGPNNQWNQQHFTERLPDRYSFGWWLGTVRDGRAAHIRMSGRGGNILFVVPDADLVLAVTNDKPSTAPDAGRYLKAVMEAAD